MIPMVGAWHFISPLCLSTPPLPSRPPKKVTLWSREFYTGLWWICLPLGSSRRQTRAHTTHSQRARCWPWRELKTQEAQSLSVSVVNLCVRMCVCACLCVCILLVRVCVFVQKPLDKESLSAAGASPSPPLCSCEEIKHSSSLFLSPPTPHLCLSLCHNPLMPYEVIDGET